MRHRINVLILALAAYVISSCQKAATIRHEEGRAFKVALVHTYNKELPDYEEYNRILMEAFKKHGIEAEFKTHYLNLFSVFPQSPFVKKAIDSLKIWQPDLILIEDDYGALSMLRNEDSILHNTPIVLGGLNLPDWDLYNQHDNLVVWEEVPDFKKAIDIACDISKNNLVEIELDHTPTDSLLKEKLSSSINHRPYINNSDFHRTQINRNSLRGELKDSIIVLTLSLSEPESNRPAGEDEEFGRGMTRGILNYCRYFPSIVVKHDAYSDAIADRTGLPQFTTVRTGFGHNAHYLAGVFAPYEVLAQDMVMSGAYILKNEKKARYTNRHPKSVFMDYNALKQWNLNYEDLKDKYTFVNVPKSVSTPYYYYLLFGAVILALAAIIWIIVIIEFNLKRRGQQRYMERLSNELQLTDITLRNNKSSIFSYSEGKFCIIVSFAGNKKNEFTMSEVRRLIVKDSDKIISQFEESIQKPGQYSLEFPFRLINAETHWLEIRYTIHEANPKEVSGIIMLIDSQKKNEMKLRIATSIAQSTKHKEQFLNDLTHSIRTHLNPIMGFSELITEGSYTGKELPTFYQELNENSKQLMNLVNNILEYSRMDSGRVIFEFSLVRVSEVIQRAADRWKTKKPNGVKFHLIKGMTDSLLYTDEARLEQLLGELLQNAYQHTKTGFVAIGWTNDTLRHQVSIYVEDTGCGIAPNILYNFNNMFNTKDAIEQGAGIGINICKVIAEGIHGRMKVESIPEIGSKFVITLDEYEEKEQ